MDRGWLRIMMPYFILMVLYFHHCSEDYFSCEPSSEFLEGYKLALKKHGLSSLEEHS